jgi:hypothetical protein
LRQPFMVSMVFLSLMQMRGNSFTLGAKVTSMQALGFLLELAPGLRGGFRQVTVLRSLPCHLDSRRLLELWRERGVLVVGHDIPSRRMTRLLPNLALCDYRAARSDFRIRLAGFGLIRRFGKDISHHYLSEVLSEDEHECLRSAMMRVRDIGAPVFIDAKIHTQDRQMLHFETTLLRVFAADRSTPLVLAGMFFFDPPSAA